MSFELEDEMMMMMMDECERRQVSGKFFEVTPV